MIVQLIEDDTIYTEFVRQMFAATGDVTIESCVRLDDLIESNYKNSIDLLLVDIRRPDSVSIEDDFLRLRKITQAPIVFITQGDTAGIRNETLDLGAEAVIDKSDLSEGLVRQLILNVKARAGGRIRQNVEDSPVERSFTALKAPLAYLESGLNTLGDVMRETGKVGSSQFVEHMCETIQAIKQYTEDDLSTQSGGALHIHIQQSFLRIQELAETRKINLKVDWEEAGFRHIGSDALVQLGVQHLLEGVLRCCTAKDGIWMQGEKASETGSSVLRVHMSRRVLPSSEILFPGSQSNAGVGLDALSSMQLGGLLLMLTPKQVELSSEQQQQLLSVFL